MHFTIDAHPRDHRRGARAPAGRGHRGRARQRPEDGGGATIMVGRFGARSKRARASRIEVAVDTRALHFFDPETGSGSTTEPKERERRNDEATLHPARAARGRARASSPPAAAATTTKPADRRRHDRGRDGGGERSPATSPCSPSGPARSGEAFQAVIDGFKEENPDVTVKYKSAGDSRRPCSRPRSRAATRPTSPRCRSRASWPTSPSAAR